MRMMGGWGVVEWIVGGGWDVGSSGSACRLCDFSVDLGEFGEGCGVFRVVMKYDTGLSTS